VSFAQKVLYAADDVSRKGAKAQSAAAFFKFLFAPLRTVVI
jgi:hypothetical protein